MSKCEQCGFDMNGAHVCVDGQKIIDDLMRQKGIHNPFNACIHREECCAKDAEIEQLRSRLNIAMRTLRQIAETPKNRGAQRRAKAAVRCLNLVLERNMAKLPEQILNDGPHAKEGCCTRCGRPIKGGAIWLELDQRIQEYHDFGDVPEADSQGAFAFGEDCAKALRRRARAAFTKKKEKETLMEIQITEHKSVGTLNPIETSVRVFVDRDFDYGYFVPEHALFRLLNEAQRADYLKGDSVSLDVTPQIAQAIIDLGQTPFQKRRVVP